MKLSPRVSHRTLGFLLFVFACILIAVFAGCGTSHQLQAGTLWQKQNRPMAYFSGGV